LKVIIVGAGEVGFHIAQRLAEENKEVVVIDKDAAALARLTDALDVQPLEGSGSDPKVLEEAGIQEAQTFLAVTDSDETNLIACFFANVLAPDVKKLARIRSEAYTDFRPGFLEASLNLDRVINPDVEVVRTIERLISVPDAEDVSEFAEGRLHLIGIRIKEGCPVLGASMAELRQAVGNVRFVVGAIFRNDALLVPYGRDVIQRDDLVYVVCETRDLKKVLRFFGCRSEHPGNVLIIGGGDIGLRLARRLEKQSLHVRLLEKDLARCQVLADSLDHTIVLHGDGTDQRILLEENVGRMDLVVALTGDEETNILCSLLTRRLGARMAITRISKFAYMPIVNAIGLGHIVSPRLSAINTILQYVRTGKILSAFSLKGEEAEVLEVEAVERSGLVGRPLKDIKFPKGAIVLAVLRGTETIIPTGDTAIQPGERVLILSTRRAMARVEEELSVKMRTI